MNFRNNPVLQVRYENRACLYTAITLLRCNKAILAYCKSELQIRLRAQDMGFKKIQAHYRQVQLITGLVVCALVMISAAYSALPANAKSPAAAPGQSQTTVLAVVSNAATKIVSQPDGDTLLTLDPGAVVTAFGRTSDSAWIAVRSENGKVGWMKASDTVRH